MCPGGVCLTDTQAEIYTGLCPHDKADLGETGFVPRTDLSWEHSVQTYNKAMYIKDRAIPYAICSLACQGDCQKRNKTNYQETNKQLCPVDKYLYVERNPSAAPRSTEF